MSFTIDDTTTSLVTNLIALTGHKFGDGELPQDPEPAANEPYGIVTTIPGGSSYGGMAGSMEMASAIFQITIVGHTNSQCRKFQQKIHSVLDDMWFSIVGCLGPARVAVGGIVKEDDRTYVANDTLYMEITQQEEA